MTVENTSSIAAFSDALESDSIHSNPPSPAATMEAAQVFQKNVQSKATIARFKIDVQDISDKLAKPRLAALLIALDTNLAASSEPVTIKQAFELNEKLLLKLKGKTLTQEQHEKLADIQLLAKSCKEIFDLIKAVDPNKPSYDDLQKIRDKLNAALNSTAYLNKKNETTLIPFYSRFLQCLSFQFTQAEGMPVYQEAGKAAIEANKVTDLPLDEKMEKVYSQKPADSKGLKWTLTHISENVRGFFNNFFGLGRPQGKNYSAKLGDIIVHDDHNDHDKRISLSHGASPAADFLFRAQLLWEKFKGIFHLHHTLEYRSHTGERNRLEAQRKLAKENENFDLMGTLLNGHAWDLKGEFKDITSVDQFLLRCKKLIKSELPEKIKDYTGYAVPLSDADIERAFECAKQAFKAVICNEDFYKLSPEEKKLKCRAMLLGLNGFLTIQSVMNFATKLTTTGTMSQACKQGVDRGPMMNAITIAYIRLIENGTLSEADQEQILGMMLVRAPTVDSGRVIITCRREATQELLRLIRQNDYFLENLRFLVGWQKDKISPIRFEALPSRSNVEMPSMLVGPAGKEEEAEEKTGDDR